MSGTELKPAKQAVKGTGARVVGSQPITDGILFIFQLGNRFTVKGDRSGLVNAQSVRIAARAASSGQKPRLGGPKYVFAS